MNLLSTKLWGYIIGEVDTLLLLRETVIRKDKGKIMKYAGIDELKFILFFSVLEKKIETISRSEYDNFLPKSKEIAPHIKDAPYFALALSLNCPIWSDEKAFKKQSAVKIFSTAELIKLL